MPQATFLISFDCEAKWGVADRITDRENHFFTNARLTQTYQRITELLSRYGIKATFAFVGALTLSEEAYQKRKEEFFSDNNEEENTWVAHFKRDAEQEIFDGWLNPELLDIVGRHPEHEIAAHGFTHTPLSESSVSLAGFTHEMECLKKLPVFQRNNLTLVYPRNKIGYKHQLKQYGFIGYRGTLKPDRMTTRGRMINLMDAVNLFQPAQVHSDPQELIRIPAGFILNWRFGIRKFIPFSLTCKCWKQLLHNALVHKRVLHLWTHPHNFVSGDRMFELLERILPSISQAQKAGKIINYTQAEYAQQCQLFYG